MSFHRKGHAKTYNQISNAKHIESKKTRKEQKKNFRENGVHSQCLLTRKNDSKLYSAQILL